MFPLLSSPQALEAQEHYTEAIADMKKLLELDPELKVPTTPPPYPQDVRVGDALLVHGATVLPQNALKESLRTPGQIVI